MSEKIELNIVEQARQIADNALRTMSSISATNDLPHKTLIIVNPTYATAAQDFLTALMFLKQNDPTFPKMKSTATTLQ